MSQDYMEDLDQNQIIHKCGCQFYDKNTHIYCGKKVIVLMLVSEGVCV